MNVAGQAERVVSARAFLWGSGAKVVVSDIENTIARRFVRRLFPPRNEMSYMRCAAIDVR